MSIHSKVNPVGIDKRLLQFQTALNGLSWTNTEVYGRLYITEKTINKDVIKIAESYSLSGEYVEVFIDDTKNAVFGFIVGDSKTNMHNIITSDVKLICSCNANALYDSIERKDEEILLLVLSEVYPLIPGNKEISIKTKLTDVFSEISTERLRFRDLHPWFNFSLSFELNYLNNN